MTPVYLVKRYLKSKKASGRRDYRWGMRWPEADPDTLGKVHWGSETTGTADKTAADALRQRKWDQLNGLAPMPEPEPEPVASGPTWDEAKAAVKRAMEADNLRRGYIHDCQLTLGNLRTTFPATVGPGDVTPEMANEYKRQRAERGLSAWSLKSDLATIRAAYNKWLISECGLLKENPFAKVKPPKCDEPDVRIVTTSEAEALCEWLSERWNNWRLPLVYLETALHLGWRAAELASIRTDDMLPDGIVRVAAERSKTRRVKYGCLPPDLYVELQACSVGGWAFGRFADELRRLLILWKRRPNHAARVQEFTPARLVGWMQDELARFNDEQSKAAASADPPGSWERFTLHDFRRTAITGMQTAGVSEKEASIMVGVTPEVMRRHYDRFDKLGIARRSLERRQQAGQVGRLGVNSQQSLRARCAQG